MSETLLSVRDFSVVYDVDPPVEAVKNVTLELRRGEILGLAGESGCGKTTLAYGVQRLLRAPAVISGGSVTFHDASGVDVDINSLDVDAMQRFRWDKVSMVFQGAMNALNPVATIGSQLEGHVLHRLHGRGHVVLDREVAHGEQGVCHRFAFAQHGSDPRASSRATRRGKGAAHGSAAAGLFARPAGRIRRAG